MINAIKKNKGKEVRMMKGGEGAVLDGVFSYEQGDEGLSGGFQEEVLRKACKFPEVGMFGYSRRSKEASEAGIEMKKG